VKILSPQRILTAKNAKIAKNFYRDPDCVRAGAAKAAKRRKLTAKPRRARSLRRKNIEEEVQPQSNNCSKVGNVKNVSKNVYPYLLLCVLSDFAVNNLFLRI